MRHHKQDEYPHQTEVPDARFVVTTQHRGQPGELHGFVNRPARQDRQQPRDTTDK